LIAIKNSHIRLIGYCLLIINIIVFFLTWLQWYVSIPATILLLFGFYKLAKNINKDQRVILISKRTLLLLCGIMLAWTVFSGVGGAFPQKYDLHWRNAILHDLINYSWPVRYSDGFDSSLTYYLAFWLVPALIGKIATFLIGVQAGWIAANVAQVFYCASILCVVMLLLLNYLKATSMKRMLMVAGVLIFFSGMDIVPIVLGQLGEKNILIGTHLEWWTYIQYSSNTTQLSWVFNQAIPAWLVTALLLHERNLDHYAFLGLLLLPFGPIPFIGVFFIMVLQAFHEFLCAARQHHSLQLIKQIFSMPNIAATMVIFPIYYLYYSTNSATSNSGGLGLNYMNAGYFSFVVFEFLVFVILIWRNSYTKPFFIFSVIGLLLIPLFTIGSQQDFCMRASIPLLFIIMVYVSDYLLQNISVCSKGSLQINIIAFPLIICLVLGAATPLTEFRESYTQIIQSGSNRASIIADKLGTLGNGDMERNNFITKNSSDTIFYRYLAKDRIRPD
jgi:hypothetical protein